MPEKSFSLKDILFNPQKVAQVAQEIKQVYPAFESEKFTHETSEKFPALELKQRISWIREMLHKFLPQDYEQAVTIIIKSLPPEKDNTLTDNDFGDFIYAPYTDFIATYGCKEEYLQFSLDALKQCTMRFSAEDSIRYFINAFPKETMKTLELWSTDEHYHVRRLASEGTRPKLPWCQKITISPEQTLPILNNLFADTTRYVTRSVANHMNDISKINPELVLETLQQWKESEKQNPKEMEYVINHSLRTLIKQGYKKAIAFLNFSTDPEVTVLDFHIKKNPVQIGTALEFECKINALKDEQLIIDYTIYFQNKAGAMQNKKIFKLKKLNMKANETVTITKQHKMIKDMTTRTLYSGEHKIELQINGKKVAEQTFHLVS